MTEPLPGFRRDRFNQHYVSLATGNVVDRAEMERIAGLAKPQEPPKPRRELIKKLKQFGELL